MNASQFAYSINSVDKYGAHYGMIIRTHKNCRFDLGAIQRQSVNTMTMLDGYKRNRRNRYGRWASKHLSNGGAK